MPFCSAASGLPTQPPARILSRTSRSTRGKGNVEFWFCHNKPQMRYQRWGDLDSNRKVEDVRYFWSVFFHRQPRTASQARVVYPEPRHVIEKKTVIQSGRSAALDLGTINASPPSGACGAQYLGGRYRRSKGGRGLAPGDERNT